MLKSLTIKNFALIEDIEFVPDKSLNIITGETGAGKTILIGALSFLLGSRSDVSLIKKGKDKCIVEGQFEIKYYNLKNFFNENELDYEDSCIIRREINHFGKSRAFINDTPVNLQVIKSLGNLLVDIHSQHEKWQLNSKIYSLNLLDTLADNSLLYEVFTHTFSLYNETKKKTEELKSEVAEFKKARDYILFQFNELLELSLTEGEQENAETELKLLENAEEIKLKLHEILQLLNSGEYSVESILKSTVKTITSVKQFLPNLEQIYQRFNSMEIELKDLISEIENTEQSIDYSKEKILAITQRLDKIYRLEKKHGCHTVSALLKIKEEYEKQLNTSFNKEEEITNLEVKLNEFHNELLNNTNKLTESRKLVIPGFEKRMTALLKETGIPFPKINIEHTLTEINEIGQDCFTILFSANKGQDLKVLTHVASGGELSRLLLCIKYILAEKKTMPLMIFDEIDSGISGAVSLKVAKMIQQLSEKHQVICITHLPQISSKGDAHYFVYKETKNNETLTKIRKLNREERIMEIAQMISGSEPSELARKHAEELMRS